MITCKLCHNRSEGTKADTKMCRKCFNALTKYKRLVVKDTAALPPGNVKFLKDMEKLFEFNIATGGYVPRCYGVEHTERACATCKRTYVTADASKYCRTCQKRERAYRSLLHKNPGSPTLDWYNDTYKMYRANGGAVPKVYLDMQK